MEHNGNKWLRGKIGSTAWFAIALISALSTTVLLLSRMVTDPGNTMTEPGGDPGKNYFVFLYHSLYAHGIWFDGMNYPYGENVIYVDGQPALSCFLSCFKGLTGHQALAAMNLLISFSVVLAILFTYRILIRFGVRPFLAILFSSLIMITYPQLLKVRAHFGMAYLCQLPMLFYWTLVYHNTRKLLPLFYTLIMGALLAFMHLYLGAVVFMWFAFYCLGILLLDKGILLEKFKKMVPIGATVAALFLCIKMLVFLTDPLKDRPMAPYTSLDYTTHWNDLFTSPFSPLWKHLREWNLYTDISYAGEGFTYPGVITMAVFLIATVAWMFRKIKNRGTIIPDNGAMRFESIWLFIAFCSLFLAMNFMATIGQGPGFLKTFKQFRSVGRFSWIFYYLISVFTVVTINNWYGIFLPKRPYISYLLVMFCVAVWAEEGKGYVQYTRGFLADSKKVSDQFFYKNDTDWPHFLESLHHHPSDFQAILLLPFIVSGSDKLWVGDDPSWALSIGAAASVQLHLPLVDACMTRSSWSIAKKQVKTVAGPFSDKPMLSDLKSNKPFMLLKLDWQEIDPDQQYLYEGADSIGYRNNYYLYACYPDRIRANDKKHQDSIRAVLPYLSGNDTCLDNAGSWFVNHFDTGSSPDKLFGNGAMHPLPNDTALLASIAVAPRRNKEQYEFSCWFLLDDKSYRSPEVTIQMLDGAGKEVGAAYILTKASVDNEGMWFRMSQYFYIPGTCRSVVVRMVKQEVLSYLAYDEMMLRPATARIVSKANNGKIMVNNHFLPARNEKK